MGDLGITKGQILDNFVILLLKNTEKRSQPLKKPLLFSKNLHSKIKIRLRTFPSYNAL